MMTQLNKEREKQFPIGASIDLDSLDRDPNPIYARLRRSEPVTWAACLQSWLLTRYQDIATVLRDSVAFTVADPQSLLSVIFGPQILSVDGEQHDKYRRPLHQYFTPTSVRATMTESIRQRAAQLLGPSLNDTKIELRSCFASRYPVLNILDFIGLSDTLEPSMRQWYDDFERALSNFGGVAEIEARGKTSSADFMEMFKDRLARPDAGGFIRALKGDGGTAADDVARNALTIFFGGISTVEALILNATWVLCADKNLQERLRLDPTLIKALLEETMRWASPVQSSIRLATRDFEIAGILIRKGERVSCMLGAANRDPALWPDPDTFDIDRPNIGRHIGFSMGRHFCLGSHLARLEAEIAIAALLAKFGHIAFAPNVPSPITGSEFRQPRALHIIGCSRH
ncbi:cytochrome P450 [Rhizobium sp. KVB221]|uniref:Cytochrome P450 n=1 Tax=Rhizobium setariae TaxID=2801340 RepID=A0A937CQU1_9HYPH|nr:cytochrome P450 [Rhizobium setariae]MBL0373447.1 cytochrome P450 [Rhizobium setariae]